MHCSIESDFSNVKKLSVALQLFCTNEMVDNELSGQLELMLVEAVNNVIEHAYQNEQGLPIEVEFTASKSTIMLIIKDHGKPIPSSIIKTEAKMPETSELPEGGWGLALIHSLSDDIKHYTEAGTNTLVLSKNRQ